MSTKGAWQVLPDADALAAEAARRFVISCGEAVARAGRFTVALSGGSTPRALFGLLAASPYRDQVDWSRVHVAWGDERCVPPNHKESNYLLAREQLLDRVGIPATQVHRIPAELPDREAAARAYEATLRALFGNDVTPEGFPRFDLVHLGVGIEGHTASLFPGNAALFERSRLVVASYVEQVGAFRITVTLPVLNSARAVLFMAAGADKAAILREVREHGPESGQLPAAMVRPVAGQLIWLVDRAAAAHLELP